MAERFMQWSDTYGMQTLTEFTSSSTGVSEAGKGVGLNDQGVLDPSLMPPGVNIETVSVTAGENLTAGHIVNLYNDSGAKARKADAGANRYRAQGFVLDTVTSGNLVNVYLEGKNNQLSGLTPGTTYFLDATTPGTITDTAPTGNVIIQEVGWAYDTTALSFEPSAPIRRGS